MKTKKNKLYFSKKKKNKLRKLHNKSILLKNLKKEISKNMDGHNKIISNNFQLLKTLINTINR